MVDTPNVPGQPGSVPPARKTQTSGANANLSAGLLELAKVMAEGPKAMEQLSEALVKMREPIKANTEVQKEYTKSVKDAVDMMEDMLGNIKDIKTESGKLKLFKPKDLEDIKKVNESLEKIQAGYTALKKAGPMMDRSQTRWLKDDMTKIASAMKEVSKGVDVRKMTTLTKQMSSIAADAQKAAKAFEKIDFTKQVASAKAVGGSFKGMAQSLALMTKNMQGMIGMMTKMQGQMKRGAFPGATPTYTHRGAFPRSGGGGAPPPRHSMMRYQEDPTSVASSLGGGISTLAGLMNPRGQRVTPALQSFEKASARVTQSRILALQRESRFKGINVNGMGGSRAERNDIFKQMASRPGVLAQEVAGGHGGMGGMLDRFIAKKVLASGGEGLMGRVGGKLMGAGGGSALGGLGSIMGKLAGPLSIITGILEVLQAGADRNKDTFSALGQGGMVLGSEPGKMKDTYNSWTSALKPGWGSLNKASMYGVDFESNASIMKQIVNAGIGVNGMQKGHSTGAMGALEGGRATDEFSGVMRNAYMFSSSLGLTKDEGAQTTMKFLKEFSMSMGEVEDLFVHLHTAVKTTGLTTTSYLNILEGITSQFDKMNKSLHFATGLISTLGKNARFTAEDIASMAKGLFGDRKDLTHGTFAYQVMGAKEREDVIQVHEKRAAATRDEVATAGFSADANDEVLRRGTKGRGIGISSLIERYIKERQTAQDFRATGGDALKMGAVGELHNTPMSQMAQNIALFRKSMEASGSKTKMVDFMKGGANVSDLATNPAFAAIAKSLNLKPEELADKMGPALSQYAEEVRGAMTNDATRRKLGLSKEDIASLKEQTAGGKDVADTEKFAEMAQSSTALTKIFEKGTKEEIDDARKNAKAMAEENRMLLTGPLDYIKAMLKAILDNILDIVAGIMAMLSSSLFSMTQGAQDLARKKGGDKWNAGFVNGGDTIKGVEAGSDSFNAALNSGKVDMSSYKIGNIKESIRNIKELYKVAAQSGDADTIKTASDFMKDVITLQDRPQTAIDNTRLTDPSLSAAAIEAAKKKRDEFTRIKAGQGAEDAASIPQGNRIGATGSTDPLRGLGQGVTSQFGERLNPVGASKGEPGFHLGRDTGAKVGTPVYSAISGTMTVNGGTATVTSDDGQTQYVYKHLQAGSATAGRVAAGDLIAKTDGSRATDPSSTGPHLHTEVKKKTGSTWGWVNPDSPNGPIVDSKGNELAPGSGGSPQLPPTPPPSSPPKSSPSPGTPVSVLDIPPLPLAATAAGGWLGAQTAGVVERFFTSPSFLQVSGMGPALQPTNKSGETKS